MTYSRIILTVLVLTIILSASVYSQIDSTSQSHTLHVEIKNIESARGTMMLALYNNPSTFLKEEVYKGITQEVVILGMMKIAIPGLPSGAYAISIYHDENKNGKLDTKIFGLPKEPFGFSNNAKGKLGPPSFDKAKFELNAPNQVIEITLK